MASSLYLPIVLLLKQIDLMKNTKFNNILNMFSVLICIVTIWTYILSNNATYVATHLFNKQMYSVGNTIVEKIQENAQITDDMPIVIFGQIDFSLKNDDLLKLTNYDVSNVNMWTWQIFLQDNLGLGHDICTFEDATNIIETQEFLDMPIFPNEGFIKIIDGTAVVKLNY